MCGHDWCSVRISKEIQEFASGKDDEYAWDKPQRTEAVPVNPAIKPYLDLYPHPNGRELGFGIAEYTSAPTVPTNEDNAMVRIDHQLTANTTATR